MSNNKPLRIAFVGPSRPEWVAGTHYLKNLFIALKRLGHSQSPEIVLLKRGHTQPDNETDLGSYADQLLSIPIPSFWRRLALHIQRRWDIRLGPEPMLASYLRAHHIDGIFGQIELGPQFSLPLLAWIPDFQHLNLPHLFSAKEIRRRNRDHSRVASYADRIILSSRAAFHDFERFAPQSIRKARVLPFVAQVPVDVYDSNPAWVCQHYHLPERFFYLPNQFWKHKNHETVVQALARVKIKYPEITVVCTGNTRDFRDPLYFERLSATVEAENLADNWIVLGLIPHNHIFQLVRQSLAVLQPSLFEGWSTTVEEAKSIGKHILLSDIPVHQEQAPPQASFFDPRDPDALADCLVRIWVEKSPGPDYEFEALAREQLPSRTQEFGQAFVKILKEVVSA